MKLLIATSIKTPKTDTNSKKIRAKNNSTKQEEIIKITK